MHTVGVIFVHFDLAFGQILVKLYLKKVLKFYLYRLLVRRLCAFDIFSLLNPSISLSTLLEPIAKVLKCAILHKIPLFKITRILDDFKI